MVHTLAAVCSGGLLIAVVSVNDVALVSGIAAVLAEGDGAGAYSGLVSGSAAAAVSGSTVTALAVLAESDGDSVGCDCTGGSAIAVVSGTDAAAIPGLPSPSSMRYSSFLFSFGSPLAHILQADSLNFQPVMLLLSFFHSDDATADLLQPLPVLLLLW
jgi:hypothetical protein